MLTEYKGKVFNAEINGNLVTIWKYVFVEGFKRVQTRRGITYYEKIVPKNEVGEFFSVTFFACIMNRRFIVNSLESDKLDVICDDQEYAETHDFSELEHGVWIKKMTLEEFDTFKMIKSIENSDETLEMNLNSEQLKNMWNIYIKEVDI